MAEKVDNAPILTDLDEELLDLAWQKVAAEELVRQPQEPEDE